MALSQDKIKQLLAQPQKKKRASKSIDPNIRDIQTWFKLAPRVFGATMDEHPLCSNPNCTDDRPPRKTAMGKLVKMQHTIVIDGTRMCRRCFLAGYGLAEPEEQLRITKLQERYG